tara:strand:- start:3373 stop:3825 length:453 start_codon:yes stop_codon:yes gene_type:complete
MSNVINTSKFDYDLEPFFTSEDMSNKLFCTFSSEDSLVNTLSTIQEKYKILYNKIFVLYAKSQNEYMCTYNVDLGNVSNFIENTILVHRKKETNTLYTINALNTLIRGLNNGELDTTYKVTWPDYRNSILLTKGPELKQVSTKLHKIIEL